MNWYNTLFIIGQAPANAMHGEYNIKLVILSYIIACLASYIALDMSSHLKRENSKVFKICWWFGGAIIMGAGIWSMHFVGMLAFKMDMPMSYNPVWTGISMIVAIITAGFAFLFFMIKHPKPIHYILSGIILGAAIPTMHYTGMTGMNNVVIRYNPEIFALSILIAVFAATAALWLAANSDQGTFARRTRLKIVSALIMGFAIAGMHYTGMAAAILIPANTMESAAIDPTILGVSITIIVLCIMIIAIILSTTKYYLSSRLSNEKNFLEVVLNNLRGGVIAFDPQKKLHLYNKTIKNLFPNIDTLTNSSSNWDEKLPLLKIDKRTPLKGNEYPLEQIFQGKKIKSLEVIVPNIDGKDRVLSIDGQLLTSEDQENLGAVLMYQDITERKEIDQMKNEFISTVSHELRTPLTSIRGSLGLIMGGSMGDVPKEIGSLLEIASNNSERLVRLINDILDTEKIESGKMIYHFAKTNISKLLEQAVIANKAYADKYKVSYEIVEFVPDVIVLMDPDRIRQVIDNLLSNAAKFSRSNNTIAISMKKIDGKICIAVADKGIGIPLEYQSSIFSKFYQADSSDVREKGGTGLGLSICKSIIEAHNGKIWFKSIPNVGTTFYFELLESQPESTHTISANTNNLHKKILICEDEPDVSKLLSLILKNRGYSSVIVSNIAEAKKILESQEFCLMTLDLLLPDGNGLELLQWLRTKPNLEKLPVVVISAVSIEEQKIKGAALGIVDWINKPIDEDRLYRDVSQVLGNTNSKIKPKILHVEDEPDIAKIVASVVSDIADTEFTPTVSGAIKMLSSNKYDLIILDLNLKDASGYKVLSYLEEHGFNIPVVILSVDEVEQDISKYIAASMVKSRITNTDLLDKIVSILEKQVSSQ